MRKEDKLDEKEDFDNDEDQIRTRVFDKFTTTRNKTLLFLHFADCYCCQAPLPLPGDIYFGNNERQYYVILDR